jgi:hypothetical protein
MTKNLARFIQQLTKWQKILRIYIETLTRFTFIDDENYPYKGVKGRAVARISEDIQKNLPIVGKINIKYLGTIEHPLANVIMENTRNGIEIVIEITPNFFSAWDFGKAM